MRIFYCLSGYISHRLAGLEYMACLRSLGHEVFCNYPEFLTEAKGDRAETVSERPSLSFVLENDLLRLAAEADLIILHEDPAKLAQLHELLPWLRLKRSLVFLPWENEVLPQTFIAPLRLSGRIWTCSEFCRRAFKREFAEVDVLPHLVRRPVPSQAGLNWGRDLLASCGAHRETIIFLSVLDGLNPRKNLPGLLTAFSLLRRQTRRPVKLLIKQYRAALPLDQYPDVINVSEMLTEDYLAALHVLSRSYVSPHFAEGWGLSLSTAMAFGKTVIATAYSGNLEFMDQRNSLLLPYKLEPVSAEMSAKIPLFNQDMLWARADTGETARAMRLVAEERVPPELNREAAKITERFGAERISARLRELLEKLP